jgi:hypothetical protein
MPRWSIILFISIFAISFFLHVFWQHEIAQCHRLQKQTFYAGWFSAGWPYSLAYVVIRYGLPKVLMLLGFGPLGILHGSIAAWIQSVYGVSSIFSLLQSIGARYGVSNTVFKSIGLGRILQVIKNWFWGRDYIAECVHYYGSWLTYLSMADLALVACYIFYWLSMRRR